MCCYNCVCLCLSLSLVELEKGIKGLVVMSSSLEETFHCIYDARVPPLWEKVPDTNKHTQISPIMVPTILSHSSTEQVLFIPFSTSYLLKSRIDTLTHAVYVCLIHILYVPGTCSVRGETSWCEEWDCTCYLPFIVCLYKTEDTDRNEGVLLRINNIEAVLPSEKREHLNN